MSHNPVLSQLTSGSMELPEFPEQFHPEMKPGLRIALMSFVIRKIAADFTNNIPGITDQLLKESIIKNRVDAFLFANNQIQKKIKPYQIYIAQVENQMGTTFNNGLIMEKLKNIDGAIILFEKLAN